MGLNFHAASNIKKSGSGKKGFADKWISAAGVSRDVVDKTPDNHMCCYSIKFIEE